jgi:ubiquinone/menaquinone biosynthesis C-methylase UbiE
MDVVMRSAESEAGRIQAAYAKRRWSDRYSLFAAAQLFLSQERERHVLALLKRAGIDSLEGQRILELGCGTGHWLREFVKWGADPAKITGLDLLEDRIGVARRTCPQAMNIVKGNAAALTFPSGTFDLILQSTVFTSILDPVVKRQVASEMLRVLKTGGIILWYDFHVDNPGNPDVRGVSKREIRQLFPGCRARLRRITLAPPLLRALAPYSWLACYLLSKVPFACTHYVGVIRRIAPPSGGLARKDPTARALPAGVGR